MVVESNQPYFRPCNDVQQERLETVASLSNVVTSLSSVSFPEKLSEHGGIVSLLSHPNEDGMNETVIGLAEPIVQQRDQPSNTVDEKREEKLQADLQLPKANLEMEECTLNLVEANQVNSPASVQDCEGGIYASNDDADTAEAREDAPANEDEIDPASIDQAHAQVRDEALSINNGIVHLSNDKADVARVIEESPVNESVVVHLMNQQAHNTKVTEEASSISYGILHLSSDQSDVSKARGKAKSGIVGASNNRADITKVKGKAPGNTDSNNEFLDGTSSVLDVVTCNAFQSGTFDFGPGMKMFLKSLRRLTSFPNTISTVTSKEELSTCTSGIVESNVEKQVINEIATSVSELSSSALATAKEVVNLIDKYYPTDDSIQDEEDQWTGFASRVQDEIATLASLTASEKSIDEQTKGDQKDTAVDMNLDTVPNAETFAGQSIVPDPYEMSLSKLTQSYSVMNTPSEGGFDAGRVQEIQAAEESLLHDAPTLSREDVIENNHSTTDTMTSLSFESKDESQIRYKYPPILARRMSMSSTGSKIRRSVKKGSFNDKANYSQINTSTSMGLVRTSRSIPRSPASRLHPILHRSPSKLMQPIQPEKDVVIVSRSTGCSDDTTTVKDVDRSASEASVSSSEKQKSSSGIITNSFSNSESITKSNDVITNGSSQNGIPLISINQFDDTVATINISSMVEPSKRCEDKDTYDITVLPTTEERPLVKSLSNRSLLSKAGSLLLGSKSDHGGTRKSFGFSRSSSNSLGSNSGNLNDFDSVQKRQSLLCNTSDHVQPSIKGNHSFLSVPSKPSWFSNFSKGSNNPSSKPYQRFMAVHETGNDRSELLGVSSKETANDTRDTERIVNGNRTPTPIDETRDGPPSISVEENGSFYVSPSQSFISDVSMNASIVSKRSVASSVPSNNGRAMVSTTIVPSNDTISVQSGTGTSVAA